MDEKATISRRAVGKHIIVRLPIVSVGVIINKNNYTYIYQRK